MKGGTDKLCLPTQISLATNSWPVWAVPGLLHARAARRRGVMSQPCCCSPSCTGGLHGCQVCEPGLIAEGEGPLGVTFVV